MTTLAIKRTCPQHKRSIMGKPLPVPFGRALDNRRRLRVVMAQYHIKKWGCWRVTGRIASLGKISSLYGLLSAVVIGLVLALPICAGGQ